MIISLSGRIASGKDTFALMLKAAIAFQKLPNTFKESTKENGWTVDDRILTNTSGYQTKRFAGALKQIVAILIGCTVEQLEDRKFKESYLGDGWSRLDYCPFCEETVRPTRDGNLCSDCFEPLQQKRYTVRQFLQEVGTNAIRDVIHPNAWVNALFAQYKPKFNNIDDRTLWPNWIITDTRFPNEADAVKQRGGILIRLERINKTEAMVRDIMGVTLSPLSSSAMHPSETALDDYTFDEVIPNQGTLEELYEHAKRIVQKYELHK